MKQDQSGKLTGEASWDHHPSGTVSGQVMGNVIDFTITYPNGLKGFYNGTVSIDGTKVHHGSVTASDGRTNTTWVASKTINF